MFGNLLGRNEQHHEKPQSGLSVSQPTQIRNGHFRRTSPQNYRCTYLLCPIALTRIPLFIHTQVLRVSFRLHNDQCNLHLILCRCQPRSPEKFVVYCINSKSVETIKIQHTQMYSKQLPNCCHCCYIFRCKLQPKHVAAVTTHCEIDWE